MTIHNELDRPTLVPLEHDATVDDQLRDEQTVEVFHVHARDCAPCDAARAAVDALAEAWDPHDNWSDIEAINGAYPTLRDEAIALIAQQLHSYPIPS